MSESRDNVAVLTGAPSERALAPARRDCRMRRVALHAACAYDLGASTPTLSGVIRCPECGEVAR